MFGLTPYNSKNYNLGKKNDAWGMKSIFDDFFNDTFFPAALSFNHPIKTDIRETEKEYIVDAELPGVKKEDIKLDLRDDVLTISVEHDDQTREEGNNYIRKERKYGSYSRSFYVENVKNEEVNAKYSDGILTVTLPKQEAGKNDRHKIEIQ